MVLLKGLSKERLEKPQGSVQQTRRPQYHSTTYPPRINDRRATGVYPSQRLLRIRQLTCVIVETNGVLHESLNDRAVFFDPARALDPRRSMERNDRVDTRDIHYLADRLNFHKLAEAMNRHSTARREESCDACDAHFAPEREIKDSGENAAVSDIMWILQPLFPLGEVFVSSEFEQALGDDIVEGKSVQALKEMFWQWSPSLWFPPIGKEPEPEPEPEHLPPPSPYC